MKHTCMSLQSDVVAYGAKMLEIELLSKYKHTWSLLDPMPDNPSFSSTNQLYF